MKHEVILPPPGLKEYVRYFWTIENTSPYNLPLTFHTMVDDSSGIIVQHHNGSSAFATHDHTRLKTNFLYGQSTQPSTTYSIGCFRITGVHFHPHAIKTLFGIDAYQVKNEMIDLDLLASPDFIDQMFNSNSAAHSVAILSEFLTSRLKRELSEPDRLVSHCVNRIIASDGKINITQLVNESAISERQLERRFKSAIGVRPKFYSRIIRFKAALKLLRQNKYKKLSDIAFELDYADQAHFIRDIRDFSGYTPRSLASDVKDLILNLHLGSPGDPVNVK